MEGWRDEGMKGGGRKTGLELVVRLVILLASTFVSRHELCCCLRVLWWRWVHVEKLKIAGRGEPGAARRVWRTCAG